VTLSGLTVYPYRDGTTIETSPRRRDADDFGDETRHALNSMFSPCNEFIPFTNAAANSVLMTPKHVCSCIMSGDPNVESLLASLRLDTDRELCRLFLSRR